MYNAMYSPELVHPSSPKKLHFKDLGWDIWQPDWLCVLWRPDRWHKHREFRWKLNKRNAELGDSFYEWFVKEKANASKTSVIRPVRETAGLGLPPVQVTIKLM